MAVVAATGFFDGVHKGHRLVLETLSREAAGRGAESLVVTFWPHPRIVLQNDARNLQLLTSLDEKKEMISRFGHRLEVLPFTREFSRLTTEEYLKDILIDRFGCTAIVLGYDNRMGSDLLSPSETAALARSLSLEVIEAPPFSAPSRDGEDAVSSTRIRKCLSEGDILAANGMLGYDYSLRGVVVAGNRIGRTIGFPTANMQLYEPLKLVPSNGVYEVEAETLGERFKGMCNIGLRPTVGGKARTIETHILDFDEDIYGHDIRISFRRKIRDEKHFPSLEALRGQLERDRASLLS